MEAWHYIDGEWVQGNPQIMGPMDHASWLASTVFDGARAFEGVAPDLDRHCERVVNSAIAMGLSPDRPAGEILEIARDGIAKFDRDAELYIKPMFWATGGFVAPDPDTTRFCLSVAGSPLPAPDGLSVTLSSFRRPNLETAPTNAKAACLYPNSGRALREAMDRGYENAVMLDTLGHVSELATANLWFARNGVAYTPVPNGTFLNGITRQRVKALLEGAGVKTVEASLSYQDFLEADEVFSTGNFAKVVPITRIDGHDLQPGPVYTRARELYWEWSHANG